MTMPVLESIATTEQERRVNAIYHRLRQVSQQGSGFRRALTELAETNPDLFDKLEEAGRALIAHWTR